MWLGQSALERIRELEASLKDSVPGDVYRASLARIAELERRVDWQSDMLLRRGGSMPVPELKSEGVEPPPPEPPAFTETRMAQAEAVVEYGRAHDLGRQQIEEALRVSVPGITEEAITEAVNRGRVM